MTRVTSLLSLPLLLLVAGAALGEDADEGKAPGWLGVSIDVGSRDGAAELSIGSVVADSPAALAGLQAGDVLLQANKVAIDGVEALKEILSEAKAGDVLALRVRRGTEEVDVSVTLGVRPAPPPRGITGEKAPPWQVERWSGLPEGVESLDVKDLAGKVVYLYCFQSWCPGCHEHGFPTLKAVQKHFAEQPNVVFVVMQTVFEGFATNTLENGLATLKKFDLSLPYAMSGTQDQRSRIMKAYNTGGTPWTVVIDPKGVVRFDGFRIETKKAIELIEGLLPKPSEGEPDSSDSR